MDWARAVAKLADGGTAKIPLPPPARIIEQDRLNSQAVFATFSYLEYERASQGDPLSYALSTRPDNTGMGYDLLACEYPGCDRPRADEPGATPGSRDGATQWRLFIGDADPRRYCGEHYVRSTTPVEARG